MEQFVAILEIINNKVLLTILGVAFGIQVIYILLFFFKAKVYKRAKTCHKFGIVIPARNEAEVIGDTIKCLLGSDYPKDKFDIFVVADNCTDNTAQIARDAGAKVYERFDPDPKHHKAGYALKYLFECISRDYPDEFEAFIKFDADNLMEPDYISRMNDAFEAGVKCARGYSNSKNIDQNLVTGISGLWYIRDCRFSSNFRSAIGQGTMLGGAGMMFSAEIIKKHGWDCLSASDDTEFTMRRLNRDKIKTMYVKDAMVYEDQPSSLKDTFKRYRRMAGALNKLFFTQGLKSFLLFFVRWKWTYFDMFLTLLFIPVCVLCATWLPIFYIFYVTYTGLMGQWDIFYKTLKLIGISLSCAFVLAFILQALLAVALEHKRIKAPVKKLMPAVFLFPVFMIIYAAAITIGVFSSGKWAQVKRNASSVTVGRLETAATDSAQTGTATDGAQTDTESDSEQPQSEDGAQ